MLAHEDGVKQRLFCKLESKSWAVAAHWLLMLLKPAPASMAFGELRSKLPEDESVLRGGAGPSDSFRARLSSGGLEDSRAREDSR